MMSDFEDSGLPPYSRGKGALGFALVAFVAACSGQVGSSSGNPSGLSDGGGQSGSSSGNTLPPDGGSQPSSSSGNALPPTGCGQSNSSSGRAAPSLPPDGRCGSTPRMLVSPSTFPVPTDAGPVSAGVGSIVASASDLYYTIYVVQANGAGLSNAYLAGSVMRIPLGGGQPTQVASGYFFGLPVLGATSVFFKASNAYPNNGSDAIVSVPLAGGPPTTVLTLASNDPLLNGLATDGTFVYFGDQDGVEAIPLESDSGAPARMTLTPGAITDGMGVFGQHLIFTLPQGGVESVPLPPRPNSPVTMLGTSAAAPVELTSCGSNACWLAEGSNSLDEMSPLGGTPTTIATLTGPLANWSAGSPFSLE